MTFRFADAVDIPLLADANAHLLEDERHERRFSREGLIERWTQWLSEDYRAVVFEQGEAVPIAYALFKSSESGIYSVSSSSGGIAAAKATAAPPLLCCWVRYGRQEHGYKLTSCARISARWVSGER